MFHAGENITRAFTCEEFALMDDLPPDGWEVITNTCAFYLKDFHSPFAAFTPDFGAGGITTGTPRRYMWQGVISGNRAIIPVSELTLPTREASIEAYVNRDTYHPSVPGHVNDFFVNNVDNSLDFETGAGRPNLNGMKIKVYAWK